VSGVKAARLAAGIEAAPDEARLQQLLAKATGHYKHGNEG
jgi:hypothetical protein